MAEMTCLQVRRAVLKLRKAIKADREPLDARRIAEIDCLLDENPSCNTFSININGNSCSRWKKWLPLKSLIFIHARNDHPCCQGQGLECCFMPSWCVPRQQQNSRSTICYFAHRNVLMGWSFWGLRLWSVLQVSSMDFVSLPPRTDPRDCFLTLRCWQDFTGCQKEESSD